MERQYMYLFVRRDLSMPQQIVQASHASACIGQEFHADTNIVLLDCEHEIHLKDIAEHLESHKVSFTIFYEPDVDQYTSIATEPLCGAKRNCMKKYQLYK